jgi:peptidoglycan/LPS O-acetylase OafA/YrhL
MVTFIFGHHLLEPLWSIGVEEIFYIFWAPLLNYVNLSVAKISVFIIVFKFLLVWLSPYFIENELYFQLLGKLQFESMAVGALGAVWVFNYQEQLRSSIFIFHRLSQIILMSFITIRIVFFDYLISNVNVFAFIQGTFIFNLAVNFLFLWLILNVSLNKDSLIKFNSRVFNFLGDISYGIYMYHMLVIFTIMLVLKDYLIRINEISATILFYFLVFSGTIFVSYVSKQYFENYFIKLKSKYRL